jgi:hypothetical protein
MDELSCKKIFSCLEGPSSPDTRILSNFPSQCIVGAEGKFPQRISPDVRVGAKDSYSISASCVETNVDFSNTLIEGDQFIIWK